MSVRQSVPWHTKRLEKIKILLDEIKNCQGVFLFCQGEFDGYKQFVNLHFYKEWYVISENSLHSCNSVLNILITNRIHWQENGILLPLLQQASNSLSSNLFMWYLLCNRAVHLPPFYETSLISHQNLLRWLTKLVSSAYETASVGYRNLLHVRILGFVAGVTADFSSSVTGITWISVTCCAVAGVAALY